MSSEIESRADFTKIRYAQCWEDADILLEGLAVKAGGSYVSIASAGDNALAMLAKNPARVVAIDLSPAQICCVELRKAAYKYLSYAEMLKFAGIKHAENRLEIYESLRDKLPKFVKDFWDKYPEGIEAGFYHFGKFERYFGLFRTKILPLIHSEKTVNDLVKPRSRQERRFFYNVVWSNLRWKSLFKVFFSKKIMGRYGREKSFFKYVDEPVAKRIMQRAKYALTVLDPSQNPYLQYILFGNFREVYPFALREENFAAIKANIDRLETKVVSVEDYLDSAENGSFDGFNLSDIFEYMSEDAMRNIYEKIAVKSKKGARVAYWNMLAPRSCPKKLDGIFKCKSYLSLRLFAKDKAFFYSAFYIDEKTGE